jgi:hypothetical protein
VRHRDRLGEILHAELAHHTGAMDFNRARTYLKFTGNRLVGGACGKATENLALAAAEYLDEPLRLAGPSVQSDKRIPSFCDNPQASLDQHRGEWSRKIIVGAHADDVDHSRKFGLFDKIAFEGGGS